MITKLFYHLLIALLVFQPSCSDEEFHQEDTQKVIKQEIVKEEPPTKPIEVEVLQPTPNKENEKTIEEAPLPVNEEENKTEQDFKVPEPTVKVEAEVVPEPKPVKDEEIFLNECNQPSSDESGYTVAKTLETLRETDCTTAAEKIFSLDALDLSEMGLSNADALSGLVNLKTLYLEGNHLSDLASLSGLKNLEILALTGNMASKIAPLEGLSNLKRLYIGGNPARDYSLLNNLVGLEAAWFGSHESARVLQMKRSNRSPVAKSADLCTAGYVYRPFKTCRHPTHEVESYKKQRSVACGIEKSTPTYKSCRTAANGGEPRVIGSHQKMFSVTSPRSSTHKATHEKVRKLCLDWARSHGSKEIHATTRHGIKSTRLSSIGDVRVYFTKCEVELFYYKQARHKNCGVESLTHTLKMCAHKSHGVELYKSRPSSVCGLEAFTKNSDNSMKEANITRTFGQAQRCRSCDDKLIQNSEQAMEKAECMIYSTKIDPNDYLEKAVGNLIENEISLLSEERALEIEKL